MTYAEKLRDPRWQKVRLEILERDNFTCICCGDTQSELHVHHIKYIWGKDPWEVPKGYLLTLCKKCHKQETDHRKDMEHDLLLIIAQAGYTYKDIELLMMKCINERDFLTLLRSM